MLGKLLNHATTVMRNKNRLKIKTVQKYYLTTNRNKTTVRKNIRRKQVS